MPHLAAAAINAWMAARQTAPGNPPVLDATQREIISPVLMNDARGLFYSAVLTTADALGGASAGYFSWTIVKLYYAAFYSARALLAMNDVAIFYNPKGTPYSLRVISGQKAKKEKERATHKLVWDVLEAQLPSSPLLEAIGNQKAFEWLRDLREEANYKTPRFPDPTVPPHFSTLDRIGIQAAVGAYTADKKFLYAFDPEHAAVAFPLQCIRAAGTAIMREDGVILDAADASHVRVCLTAAGINPITFFAMWER